VSAAGPGADLRHVDTWLFDLDNTLYAADAAMGAEARITDEAQRLAPFLSAAQVRRRSP
jgi:FMN phosphatase YigB (HAD superfamily)